MARARYPQPKPKSKGKQQKSKLPKSKGKRKGLFSTWAEDMEVLSSFFLLMKLMLFNTYDSKVFQKIEDFVDPEKWRNGWRYYHPDKVRMCARSVAEKLNTDSNGLFSLYEDAKRTIVDKVIHDLSCEDRKKHFLEAFATYLNDCTSPDQQLVPYLSKKKPRHHANPMTPESESVEHPKSKEPAADNSTPTSGGSDLVVVESSPSMKHIPDPQWELNQYKKMVNFLMKDIYRHKRGILAEHQPNFGNVAHSTSSQDSQDSEEWLKKLQVEKFNNAGLKKPAQLEWFAYLTRRLPLNAYQLIHIYATEAQDKLRMKATYRTSAYWFISALGYAAQTNTVRILFKDPVKTC